MNINKTETEYNMKSIKFLLLTITTMFIIISGLMIVLGLSVYSKYHSISFLYESVKSGKFFTPSILVVILGLVMLVVTCFGFFGSLKESTCMVNTYALILALVFIVELAVVCVSFKMDGKSLYNYIDIPIDTYTSDPEFQAELDMMQTSLNCCGGNSFLDYVGLEFNESHSTVSGTATVDGDIMTIVLPTTCCAVYSDYVCSSIRTRSCKWAIVSVVVQNANILGVLGVSVMFIQVLGIIFALLLARCIRKMKSERAMLKWKMCEDMIIAREADKKIEEKNPSVFIEHSESSRA